MRLRDARSQDLSIFEKALPTSNFQLAQNHIFLALHSIEFGHAVIDQLELMPAAKTKYQNLPRYWSEMARNSTALDDCRGKLLC